MEHEPLRFLFVTADQFPPFRPDAETLFGKEFLRRGHSIDWIMQAKSPESPAGRQDWRGCTIWVAPTDAGQTRLSRVRKHALAIRNELRALKLLSGYDFVLLKDKYLISLLVLAAARLKGVPVFYWLSFPHSEASLYQARQAQTKYRLFHFLRGCVFRFLLYRILCRFSDHVFVQSEEMKRSMAARGVPEGRMTPVPMGVDLDAISAEVDVGRGDDETVVYLGSLGRARKLELLVDAFALVLEKIPTAKLLFVGGGDEAEDQPNLEQYAKLRGLADRVAFTGFLPREQAAERVAAASVGVSPIPPSPTYDVASPTKVLEYMAAGLPVVANDQPDQRLVIAGSGAGFATAYDAAEFAAALVELLADPRRAREIGERGRQYVREHRSYTVIADAVEHRLRAVLAGCANPRRRARAR